ncbi:hypothetical protein V6N13_035404 [Hibiscus sabdariffa]
MRANVQNSTARAARWLGRVRPRGPAVAQHGIMKKKKKGLDAHQIRTSQIKFPKNYGTKLIPLSSIQKKRG